MRRRGISCRDFVELRLAAFDRELNREERHRMILHRVMCSLCRRVEKQLQGLQHLSKSVWKRHHAPSNPHFFQQLETRLLQEAADNTSAAGQQPPPDATPHL